MAAQLLKSDINFVKPESTIPEVVDQKIINVAVIVFSEFGCITYHIRAVVKKLG